MALSFTTNGTDAKVIAALQVKNEKLLEALVNKMSYLMTRVQEKMRAEKLPQILAANVENPTATVEGTNIVGSLSWLGRSTDYAINPKTTQAEARRIGKGTLKPSETSGKHALFFYSQRLGKNVFANYVFHPPFPGRRKMSEALDEMHDTFVNEIRQTLTEFLRS